MTYNFTSDSDLNVGTRLTIAMPNFAGADPTIEPEDCGSTLFDIVANGTGSSYKLIITTDNANITADTECIVVVGNLTNPSTESISNQPAYTVAVDAGSAGYQEPTTPDDVSGAQITAASVTLTD